MRLSGSKLTIVVFRGAEELIRGLRSLGARLKARLYRLVKFKSWIPVVKLEFIPG